MEIEITEAKDLTSCGDGCCKEDGFIISIDGEEEHHFITGNKTFLAHEIKGLIEHIITHLTGHSETTDFKINRIK